MELPTAYVPFTCFIRCILIFQQSAAQQVIPTTVGVFGLAISCLQTAFEALQRAQPWTYDPDVIQIPWRTSKEIKWDSTTTQTLSFAVFRDDGLVMPHPPIQRAMRMVEVALRKRGFNVSGAATIPFLHD